MVEAVEMVEDEENNGYKFAVTFLLVAASFLYGIFNYFQIKPIDADLFLLIVGIISATFILIFGLFLYVFIKAFSMEIENDIHKNYLNKIASYIYRGMLLNFSILLVFAIFVLYILIEDIDTNEKTLNLFVYLAIITCFMVFVFLYLPWVKTHALNNLKYKKYLIFFTKDVPNILMFFVFFVVILFLIVGYPWGIIADYALTSPLQGQVTVDMNNIYYKDDIYIPILIQVTGPNEDLHILLLKEEFGDLSLISNISLGPSSINKENIKKVVYNGPILGDELGNGKYNVFINTTDLTPGYYEVIAIREKYFQTAEANGFYLINSS